MEAIKSWQDKTIGSNYQTDVDGSITIQTENGAKTNAVLDSKL